LTSNYRFRLKAEIGKASFVATADGGDDAIQVRFGHGRAGRQAEAMDEQIFGHLPSLCIENLERSSCRPNSDPAPINNPKTTFRVFLHELQDHHTD